MGEGKNLLVVERVEAKRIQDVECCNMIQDCYVLEDYLL